jgi:outer membrane protein assembly factor BamB
MDGTSIVIAETDDNIVGLEVSTGQVVWETPYAVSGRGYNAATPVLDGQTIIYTGSNRGAIAAQFSKQGDSLTTQELWNNQDNSVQYNTPVLKDGLLYGLSKSNVLFCINAKTGKTMWTDTVLAGARGRGGYGSIVDAGSVLFALTPAAQLIVFQPSDTEFKQIASYKVSDGGTYAYPIVAGNRLFVKDADSLTLWSID